MNLSTAVFIVNEAVRAVKVEYDPENAKYNNQSKLFKTFDTTLAKDDYVVIPTGTRHGFTVVKIIDIDFQVDFHSPEEFRWVAGKVDKLAYDAILETEKKIIAKVGKAEENKMRKELKESMGLGDVSFTDLDLMGALPKPVSMQPQAPTEPEKV
jgi:hypothetical protein